MFMHFRLFGL